MGQFSRIFYEKNFTWEIKQNLKKNGLDPKGTSGKRMKGSVKLNYF